MNVLFLDDDPERHARFLRAARRFLREGEDTITLAFELEDAIRFLQTREQFDIAFLDHDLNGQQMVEEREGTGTIAAEHIAQMPENLRPRLVVCHSYNPHGAQRMMNVFRAASIRCLKIPFGQTEYFQLLARRSV